MSPAWLKCPYRWVPLSFPVTVFFDELAILEITSRMVVALTGLWMMSLVPAL